MIFSIVIFFIIMAGLGFSLMELTSLKIKRDFEKILMSLGLGLGVFPILAVTLNLLKIPLDWKIFLIISLITPIIKIIKNKKIPKIKLVFNKSTIYIIIVLILFASFLGVYLKGAFTYPYLENDDPWDHAISSKYISIEKTAYETTEFQFHYIDPYPPSYDILMGVIHQTNDSINWTLKFFNVLIISMGIIFFYFFVLKFTKDEAKSLASTFMITMIPCFMSHFIWSQTLALVLFFPAFYCLIQIREKKEFLIPSIIIISSILVSQPSTAAIFGIMAGLYWISLLITNYFKKEKIFSKKNNLVFISLIGGVVGSLIYWIPMVIKWGLMGTIRGIGLAKGLLSNATRDTSGGIIYSIKDFIIAPLQSKMDQPTGIGMIMFFLLIIGVLIYLINIKKVKKNNYLTTLILWITFTIIGTQGNAFPIKLFPHRFWAFLAIPTALIAGDMFVKIIKGFKRSKIKYGIFIILVIGIIWTSGYPKYVVETSYWPPGVFWTSNEELQGYIQLKNLPANELVYSGCQNQDTPIGFDKLSFPWIKEVKDYKEKIILEDVNQNYNFLKKYKYQYLTLSSACAKGYGINKTNNKIIKFEVDNRFYNIESNGGYILYKLN